MSKKKKLIVITGPTAVGKTAVAIEIAKHFQTEIISADSRQFYAELNIGVARPSTDELAAVMHHFIGFLPLEEVYSAGRFEKDALALLDDLFIHHDVVVCAGGSGLFVDALLNGLDDLPSDESIREHWSAIFSKDGIEPLQKKIAELDPIYYDQMDQQNPHRLVRAIEVCLASGEAYSSLRKKSKIERPFDSLLVGLTSEREWLYNRINKRVDAMIELGLVEEARAVFSKRSLNALNTVGYKEIFDHFDGVCSIEKSIELIKQHTRQFAKRQWTWWNKKEHIHWLHVDQPHDVLRFVLEKLD